MRISDWSSDVCSSDLLLRKFGCNTSETAYVCFVTSTLHDLDHWTDRAGQYNIPRAKRVAVSTPFPCQPGGGVKRMTPAIAAKAMRNGPAILDPRHHRNTSVDLVEKLRIGTTYAACRRSI